MAEITEYKKLFAEKFYRADMSYDEEATYLYMLTVPKQDGIEEKMLRLLKEEDATLEELDNYYMELLETGEVPPGPVGASKTTEKKGKRYWTLAPDGQLHFVPSIDMLPPRDQKRARAIEEIEEKVKREMEANGEQE